MTTTEIINLVIEIGFVVASYIGMYVLGVLSVKYDKHYLDISLKQRETN